MKVLAINGSPHEHGTCRAAIDVFAVQLQEEGVETQIITVGGDPVRGCIGCNACRKMETPKCTFGDDMVNDIIEAAKTADGILVFTPVHFCGIAGALKCVLDRTFYAGKGYMKHKVGMGFAVLRRSGGTATFDVINHYFEFAQMPIASSHYWNVVHGAKAADLPGDEEGIQILKVGAKNMAWLMKSIQAGGIAPPAAEPLVRTNFVR